MMITQLLCIFAKIVMTNFVMNAIKLIRKLKLQEIIISCLCHILLNNAHEINVMFVRRFSFAKIKKKFVF